MMKPIAVLIKAIQRDDFNIGDTHWALHKLDDWCETKDESIPLLLYKEVQELHQLFKSRMQYGHNNACVACSSPLPRLLCQCASAP
jgi:hypothetical protein